MMFDKNGNATQTHVATVSGFDPVTGEFVNTYDVRILSGTGIPACSTLNIAPANEKDFVFCWDGSQWEKIIDLRESVAYDTTTGQQVNIQQFGKLPQGLTLVEPSGQYDKWDGQKWVTDTELAKSGSIVEADLKRSFLLNLANEAMKPLQYAVDLDDLTEEESISLKKWKQFVVSLNRLKLSDIPDIEWPEQPK